MQHQVLFIQGAGKSVHDEWDIKMVDDLKDHLGHEYEVRYPRMPHEAEPNYARWKKALKHEFDRLNDGAIVVGHSIGGTMMINALADEAPGVKLNGIVLLAAPFVGESGWPSEEIAPMSDLGMRMQSATPVHVFHGSADETAPVAHSGLYAKAIPYAVVHRLIGRDHQLNNDLAEVAKEIRQLASGSTAKHG